jgi:hypothetical protein
MSELLSEGQYTMLTCVLKYCMMINIVNVIQWDRADLGASQNTIYKFLILSVWVS